MRPLYLIAGPSGSGKTTLVNNLHKYYGYRPVISYTTRPMRIGEKNGVDHYFVSDEAFDRLENITAYTKFDGYRYCVTEELLERSDLYVIDPDGIKRLKASWHDLRPLVSIGILTPSATCVERMLKRGDTMPSIIKRLANDAITFANLPQISRVMLDGTLSELELMDQALAVMQTYHAGGVTYPQLWEMFASYVRSEADAGMTGIREALERCGCTREEAAQLGLERIFGEEE